MRPVVAADCAAEVARLLRSGLTFEGRPLRAGDIAVLAHKRDSLDRVRGALGAIGIPSVIVSSESIYETPAAADWLTLLEAMAQSHRPDRVRAAALTPFVGHRAADLETGGDEIVDETARVLRTWSEVLGRRGVAAALAAATSAGLESRVLRHAGGERRLTDLRHLGEVLHERAVVEGDGLTALTTWLRERIQDARHEERTRRLESDAEAVALATIHASKGCSTRSCSSPSSPTGTSCPATGSPTSTSTTSRAGARSTSASPTTPTAVTGSPGISPRRTARRCGSSTSP